MKVEGGEVCVVDPVDLSVSGEVIECVASVNALAWAADGSIAAGCGDGNVLYVDTGHEVALVLPSTSSVRAVSWVPSGDLLAVGYDDGDVRAWLVEAARSVFVGDRERPEPVRALAWHPWSAVLAVASGRNVELWSLPGSNRACEVVAHDADVNALVWSPDGTVLASSSRDRTVALWDYEGESLARRATIAGHDASVYAVAWSPDGTMLASASGDRTVRIWDPSDGAAISALVGHESWVDALAWSSNDLLASGGGAGQLCVWDTDAWRLIAAVDASPNTVLSVAWSPDGTALASGSDDRTIGIWSLDRLLEAASYERPR
jgi:WD40 repeat protein